MGWSFSRRKCWLLLLLAGTAALVLLLLRPSSDLELVTSPTRQKMRLGFLGQWMWPVKRQLFRLKQAIWGPPQVVRIVSVIAEFDPGAVLPEFEVLSGVTNAATGDKALVVRLERGQRQIFSAPHGQIISQPGVVTMDGVQAQAQMTERASPGGRAKSPELEAGYWMSVWPHVRSDGLRLDCFFTQSKMDWRPVPQPGGEFMQEAFVRTNMAMGAQVRLSSNTCLLLVGGSTNARGRVTGLYIAPVVEPKK